MSAAESAAGWAARAAGTKAGSRSAAAGWSIPTCFGTAGSTPPSGTATRGALASNGWRCSSTTWTTSGCFTNLTCASWNSSDVRAAGDERWSGRSTLFAYADRGSSGLSRMVGGAELAPVKWLSTLVVRGCDAWVADPFRPETVAGKPGHGPLQWLRPEVRTPSPRLRAGKGRVS